MLKTIIERIVKTWGTLLIWNAYDIE